MAKHNPRSEEYLVYTRRSTDDLVNQRNTIEYQIKQCLGFAESRGLVVADVTIDGLCENGVIKEKHTAYKTAALDIGSDGTVHYRIGRPKFQRIVPLLAERQYRGVICLCWDRLSRNPHDDAIIKDLRTRGADIQFVEANYEKSSSGALHMDIDGMFAAHYSRVVSEKVRAANAKLRSEGKCTSSAPLGYLNQGPGSKPLDPERASIIRRMFELYATGEWSVAGLAGWARKQGLTTKPARPQRSRAEVLSGEENDRDPKSHPISQKNVELILHNPFYAGFIHYNGLETPGIHEPLISHELFDRVRRMLLSRTTSVRYESTLFFAYRGLVRCTCKRSYSPYTQKDHPYYYSRCHTYCDNSAKSLSGGRIDLMVEDLLGRACLTQEEVACMKDAAPSMFVRAEKQRALASQAIDKQRIRATRDLEYLEENKTTLLREGAFTATELAAEISRLREKVDHLTGAAVKKETVDQEQMFEKVFEFSELLKLAKTNYKNWDEEKKQRLSRLAFSELVVADGELAKFSAKDGFDKLLNRGVGNCGGQ